MSTATVGTSLPPHLQEALALRIDAAPAAPPPGMSLRPYQEEAITAVEELGAQRSLVVMATGTGKTVVFSDMTRRISERIGHGARVLIIAHRDELIKQARNKLRDVWPGAPVGIVKAQRDEAAMPVVVASIQTLARERRMARYLSYGRPDLVVLDEAHHGGAASYVSVLRALGCYQEGGPVCVGFTATPNPKDRDLARVFPEVAYHYSMEQAVEDGYLVDVVGLQVEMDGVDLSDVKRSSGDYQAADLGQAMEDGHSHHVVAQAYAEHASGRRAICFTPLVRNAHLTAQAVQAAGFRAVAISGQTAEADRERIYRQLRDGELDMVCNAMLLCLDEETEILTSDGWVGIDAMTSAHEVANWTPDGTFFERPKQVVKRQRSVEERMVTLESRNRSVRVTEGHRMVVAGRPGALWVKRPARDIVGQRVTLPTSSNASPLDVAPEQEEHRAPLARAISSSSYNLRKREGFDRDSSVAEAERRITARRSLRYADPSELTLDECRFVGFWIGDGTVGEKARGGREWSLSQSTVYPGIVEWVDCLVSRLGIGSTRYTVSARGNAAESVRWSFPSGTGQGSQERTGVYRMIPYLDKGGSRLLWGLDAEQFSALIEGLWYADGWHGQAEDGMPTGHVTITGCAEGLFSLLQAIGTVRGWTVSLSPTAKATERHRAQWRVSFRRTSVATIAGRERFTMEDVWRPERVWCVRTTSSNLITRRRGKVTVMGNTEGFDEPSVDCVIIARPTQSRGLYVQMVGRGTRLSERTGKADCLVIDLMAATKRHSLMSLGALIGAPATRADGRISMREERQRQATEAAALAADEQTRMAFQMKAQRIALLAKMRWVMVPRGFAMSLPNGDVLGIMQVDLEDDHSWRVGVMVKGGANLRLAEGLSMEYAQGLAEDHARSMGAGRLHDREASRGWREARPTPGAIANARRLGITVPPGASAGEVSDWITEGEVRLAIAQHNASLAA